MIDAIRRLFEGRRDPQDIRDFRPLAERNAEAVRRIEIRNAESKCIEVMIEMTPDRYVLHPGDEMVVEADLAGAPFHILPYLGGVTIYAGNDVEPLVTINGVAVEPDWNTPLA